MGTFDYIQCDYPLPEQFADNDIQTKDTPAQWLDTYRISEDGTLWHQAYDTEDRGDKSTTGLERFFGAMTPINKRWERERMTGEIVFYGDAENGGDLCYSAYFINGVLQSLTKL